MRAFAALFAVAVLSVPVSPAHAEERPSLRLDSIEPSTISVLGGTAITLRGAGFTPETRFHIGRAAVLRPQVSRDGTRVSAVAPPLPEGEAAGARDVSAQLDRARVVLRSAVQYAEPPDDGVERGVDRLRLASARPIEVRFDRGRISSAILRVPAEGENPAQRARGFLSAYAELFGLDQPHQDLVVRKVSRDADDGETGVSFQQTYRGLPVYGGTLKVGLSGRHVFSVMASLLRPNAYVDERPSLGVAQAEAAARLSLRRSAAAPLLAPTRLMIFDLSLFGDVRSEPALVWQVTVGGGAPWRVLVDAKTGAIRHRVRRVFESGGALHGFDFDLQDAEDEANAYDDSCFNLSDDTDVADEGWYNGDYTWDIDARAADLFARQAYAFFHENFGRHSYDGAFAQVGMWVHSTHDNAAFIEFCGSIEFSTGYVDEDVVTHEFTHGVIAYTSELEYEFASGALNESYADIMGVLQDRAYGNGPNLFGTSYDDYSDNWWVGEDRNGYGTAVVRNLQDPTANDKQPSHNDFFTWGEKNEDGDYPDNGMVHFNSGIPNHARYLMAVGGTHQYSGVEIRAQDAPDPWPPTLLEYPTRAIGEFKMKRLVWSSLKYLDSNAKFKQARDYEVAKAAQWAEDGTWGFTAEDACTVTWAWAAVGVGLGDADCDGVGDSSGIPDTDNDGIPNTEDNCVDHFNMIQADHDDDGLGNPCDPNDDNDPFIDAIDLCPYQMTQVNHPCGDADFDGVQDDEDNCLGAYNPDQKDSDGNGWADACDSDMDGDGMGIGDNCPMVFNPFQADTDGDMFGNSCDKCPDTTETKVSFLLSGEPNQPDSDGDGTPDACDSSVMITDGGESILVADGLSRTLDVE